MSHIHWYPGHIAKAKRKLKEQLNLVDVVIEVLDARLPLSSKYPEVEELCPNKPRLILLNKADLSDEKKNEQWRAFLEKNCKCDVFLTYAKATGDVNKIINKLQELARPAILALMQKGLLQRPARVMVIGMPNVGKSSIINKLIKKGKAKTGAKAGVTRQQQWVRIHPKVDLLDTPGIIPMRQDDQLLAMKLAFVNSVSENAYESEHAANELLKFMEENYKKNLFEYYKLDGLKKSVALEDIAYARNWVLSEGKPDIQRAASYILSDFRNARLGKLTLDKFPENDKIREI